MSTVFTASASATAIIEVEANDWLFGAICDLPERDGKDLLNALRKGIPLNRRLRKLLLTAEEAAEHSAGCAAAAAAELENW